MCIRDRSTIPAAPRPSTGQLDRDEEEVMLRREEFALVPLPPPPSQAVPDFDDLITGSIQATDVTSSAFDPIPGSVPENLNETSTEPERVPEQMMDVRSFEGQEEHVVLSWSLSQPDRKMSHVEWATSIPDNDA
eukprot:9160920-Karenia_brevis.AAC.1